ncbi:hypothetical protein Tsubulata_025014, partial [Turnera subulata]
MEDPRDPLHPSNISHTLVLVIISKGLRVATALQSLMEDYFFDQRVMMVMVPTAAGIFAKNIQFADKPSLMARGGGVNARLAVYKCDGSDVLKALDDAIHDNVENGILVVVACAGNNGLLGGATVPWVSTVAASSIDREFLSTTQLGNGDVLRVTYDASVVRGKIVAWLMKSWRERRSEYLDWRRKALTVYGGAAVGTDGVEEERNERAVVEEATSRLERISTTFTATGTTSAPMMAPFSSKGPDIITPGLINLNPDQSRFFSDFTVDDAINFLCFHASDVCPVVIMARGDVTCSYPPLLLFQLNYPSISLLRLDAYMEVQRTLTLGSRTNQIYK